MNTSEHAENQRSRILDAAEKCFIEQGFHSASMANISQKAQMSAGLIYRYFENKDAIILAIIDRQLEERRANIATLHTDNDFIDRIIELFDCWLRRDPKFIDPALFLDTSAEASRNPKIAQALRDGDQLSRADFTSWLKQLAKAAGKKPSDRECRSRAFALQCFIEGMALRAVREPDIDASLLAESVKRFIPDMLRF